MIELTNPGINVTSEEETRDLLAVIADHFGLLGQSLSPGQSLIEDLEADDIDRRELLVTVEELFDIRFAEHEMEHLDRIQDILSAIDLARQSQYSRNTRSPS